VREISPSFFPKLFIINLGLPPLKTCLSAYSSPKWSCLFFGCMRAAYLRQSRSDGFRAGSDCMPGRDRRSCAMEDARLARRAARESEGFLFGLTRGSSLGIGQPRAEGFYAFGVVRIMARDAEPDFASESYQAHLANAMAGQAHPCCHAKLRRSASERQPWCRQDYGVRGGH
jgi:hypothetical protein